MARVFARLQDLENEKDLGWIGWCPAGCPGSLMNNWFEFSRLKIHRKYI